jgi:hypothetical protein
MVLCVVYIVISLVYRFRRTRLVKGTTRENLVRDEIKIKYEKDKTSRQYFHNWLSHLTRVD